MVTPTTGNRKNTTNTTMEAELTNLDINQSYRFSNLNLFAKYAIVPRKQTYTANTKR